MKTAGFEVKAEDREVLESWLRSKTIPQALGMRARVVLLSAEGSSLSRIAQQLGLTERTVCLWRLPAASTNLRPGTVITKQWRGAQHVVMVVADGFQHQGRVYGSPFHRSAGSAARLR